MTKEELTRILRPVAVAIRSREQHQVLTAAARAIDPGGTVSRQAAKDLIPMQTMVLYADEPLEHAAGPDDTQALTFPMPGRIVRIDGHLRAPESGYTFTAIISINSITYKTVTFPSGVTTYSAGDNRAVQAGDLMTMGVSIVDVARGLTICVHWIPDIT